MNLKNLSTATIAIITSLFIFSCSGGNMPEEKVTFPSIQDVPVEKWEKLSQKKIYFGHQSVGFNILDGIKDVMKERPEVKLNIVETTKESDFKVGLLAHSRVGKNKDPKSKVTEFVNFINSGIGEKADAAALKFCYIDMRPQTDVVRILSDYSSSIEQLKNRYSDMIFIHFSIPLKERQTGIKKWIKKIIGRPISGVEDNVKRNEYNQMLIKQYKDKEPIFDIAKIQSTNPDGTRCSFSKDGKTYYSMVPEYTNDGGHLNEIGRKKVAEQFLILLANLN